MNQNEIKEGNKLIAEFVGKKIVDNNCELCGNDVTKDCICKGNKEGLTRTHALGGILIPLKYHSSWDWLMPVIEKISKVPITGATDISDTCYPRTFGMLQDDTGLPMFRFNCCCLYVGGTLIEAAWIAVVEFIKSEKQNVQPINEPECGKGQNIAYNVEYLCSTDI